MYCLINWIHDDDGFRPDLPENTGFYLIASPHYHAPYALFDCDLAYDEPLPQGVERISDELCELIDSGKAYPPALAIARQKIERDLPADTPKYQFITQLSTYLIDELTKQPVTPYILVRTTVSELGYRECGGYYRIIGYHAANRQVAWVSRDYYIYTNSVKEFDISEEWLQKRFDK